MLTVGADDTDDNGDVDGGNDGCDDGGDKDDGNVLVSAMRRQRTAIS